MHFFFSLYSEPENEINSRFLVERSIDFGFADMIQLPDLVSDLFGRDRTFPLSHICVREGFLDKQTACESRLALYPQGANL